MFSKNAAFAEIEICIDRSESNDYFNSLHHTYVSRVEVFKAIMLVE